MNSFRIAFDNYKRNIKVYALYIFSMVFSVLVFYNFVTLKYNPDFQKANESTYYIQGVSTAVSYLLLLFIIFFIWFASSFFLSQRKKEIGLYVFMGVTNSEIALIYAIELIFIGITAIAAGLLLGIIFCKLFIMLLAKVAILNMKINFFISVNALVETSLVFIIIFFINALVGYINIYKSKLIDLFNASKQEERLPKVNYIKGLLSIICIAAGYYFAQHAIGDKFTTNLPLSLVFIIIGTYWFFGSFYSIVMKFIINNKKILYNGVNIVSMNSIAFRIKNNYRTLTAVAILVALTLTSYGTVASLKYFVEIRDYIQTPYAISYISSDNSVKQQVRDTLKKYNKTITLAENCKITVIKPHIHIETNIKDCEAVALKYSDFIKISSDLKSTDLEALKKENLSKDETIYIASPSVIMSQYNYKNDKVSINTKNYTIKNAYKTPVFGTGVPAACFILSDEYFNLLKTDSEVYEFNGINIDNIKLIQQDLKKISAIKDTLRMNISKDTSAYSICGILYFLGAFLALVFIVATGSIIYFKLVSEAYLDKNKYVLLKRAGMTENEVLNAVSKQISISYILPLAVGIAHSCIAMSLLSKLMNFNIIEPAVKSILIFIAVYAVYFIATTRKYIKIVM